LGRTAARTTTKAIPASVELTTYRRARGTERMLTPRAKTATTAPPREPEAYTPSSSPGSAHMPKSRSRRLAEVSSQTANGIASTTPAAR
jgi:hypothetical protein